MAQLTAKQLEQKIASERPGYDVIPVDEAAGEAPADAVNEAADRTPELDELRREFLGDSAEEFDVEGGMADVQADAGPRERSRAHDDESVRVLRLHPKSRERDAVERGPGAKTIIVSNRDGAVLAEQG
jgi:hypothetical protein